MSFEVGWECLVRLYTIFVYPIVLCRQDVLDDDDSDDGLVHFFSTIFQVDYYLLSESQLLLLVLGKFTDDDTRKGEYI